MAKRSRSHDTQDRDRPRKRARSLHPDHLSSLSNELVLRILSFLSVPELAKCHRLSQRFNSLAGDSQLWKSHYYAKFVYPRASRLPGIKTLDQRPESLHFASKASRWLDDDYLVRPGNKTNWKRQYKLRNNWSRGSCAVNEIEIAEEATIPPVIVQLQDGVIYTADADGLRAWSAKEEQRLIAQTTFDESRKCPPVSLAVDAQEQTEESRLIVGFEDGAFSLYALWKGGSAFRNIYNHSASTNGVISSVALTSPYAVTMTATQVLSIYRFREPLNQDTADTTLDDPRLLHSLRSRSVHPPLTTTLRTTESGIVVSIAYALPTYLSGWTVGLQEVRLDKTGKLLESRLASAIEQHYRSLAFSIPPLMPHLPASTIGTLATSTSAELRHIHSKPTSLSYTHPYLLVSHPDNTLTLYLVTSTAAALSIGAGSRLWGHTSSVSGAHVGGRGKAVSVSRRGDELRIWELEGGFASSSAKRRLATGDLSVQLRPEKRSAIEASQAGLSLVNRGEESDHDASELTLTRGWIGFDDENVVVLKEQSEGRQALVVYDFT